MLGYTDLLRHEHLGTINDKQKQVLGEIEQSGERLLKLVQNLLLLCELKAGKTAPAGPDLDPTQVNEEVEAIFDSWAAAAEQKSIAYELNISKGNPRVRVDPLKLQHTLSNLIENALKFTPVDGKVVVTVTPCFWERRKAQSEFLFNMERKVDRKIENAVRIDVSDSGPGIAPEHHENIFGDFVQLPAASSRGTGLGLAIARRLVEAHVAVTNLHKAEITFRLFLTESRKRAQAIRLKHAALHHAKGACARPGHTLQKSAAINSVMVVVM
jgi:signal transduction histidine kinase